MTETTLRRYITVLDLAQLLGVSRSRAYQLVQLGVVPAVRIGALWRIDLEALERQFAAQMERSP
jgi:excisionase family DNA binding protein